MQDGSHNSTSCELMFSYCRSSGSDFLVAGGPTKTWVVGNSLVTITTSTMIGEGLCKRCSSNRMGDCKGGMPLQSVNDLSSIYHGTTEFMGVCSCRSSGWAEIKIRRPSGNTGWMMHLQNRPHPLSLTHPSAHSIPDSEIGLLAASLPLEKLATIGETLTGENEEMFFSREVGSFTDISFLSSISTKFSSVDDKREQITKGGARDSVTVARDEQLAKIVEESGKSKGEDSGAKIVGGGVLEAKKVNNLGEKEAKVQRESSQEEVNEEERRVEVGEEDGGGADKQDLLSIGEVEFISHAEDQENDSISTSDSKSPSTTALFPDQLVSSSQVKRSSNSQSWSENVGSSPLAIFSAPRASSYSFSMEHLPPLFSYDEGDDFSRSPSLLQGEKVMSEEEQVCFH